MKKGLKKVLLVVLIIAVLVGAVVGGMLLYSGAYDVPDQPDSITNATGLVKASGRSLYDPEGNELHLTGLNAGQILLQEGWMSPFSLEPLRNEDGSYVKDGDGNIQYPEFTEADFRAGLASNPNLQEYSLEELMAYYRSCFFTEEDFRIIAQELELNVIRLPFYYLNILNDDYSLRSEADAFAYLDWFVETAGKYGLYVILDLHGAPVTQNGYEHSGNFTGEPLLWDDEEAIAATVSLWEFVARHYTESRPDLAKWIAAYDILNEPTYTFDGSTTEECWEVFDRIYDAIRAVEDHHVIAMEGCWGFNTLPDPAEYGWENVMYEYHWYNWWSNVLSYEAYTAYMDALNMGLDYEVPVLIGEFTCFEDQEAWDYWLSLFDERGYSWTIWNYKSTVTGWWTTSWGVYTCQLKAITENEDTKCNVATCTYEEYIAFCEKTRTENCATGTLYKVLMDHKAED